MGLWDKIKGEFIDIVEWLDPTQDTMVYRFERYQNEIKYGAKLTVRENQLAVFMNEGQIADIYKPGMYTLETQNMPILTTLKGWKYGFNSPFKAEVYFLNTKVFTNLKWGTPGGDGENEGGVLHFDKQLGNLRFKAFGTYAAKIVDAKAFMTYVGTDGEFTLDEINEDIRATATQAFVDALTTSGIPLFQVASKLNEMGDLVEKELNEGEFKEMGLECVKFKIGNINIPERILKMLDANTGNVLMNDPNAIYKMSMLDSINDAANNANGSMQGFMGMAMMPGMNQMMNPLGQTLQPQQQQNFQNNVPPPIPNPVQYFVAVNGAQTGPFDLNTLGQMAKQGSFTKTSLVWKQGMANWSEAGQVGELSSVFNNVPPPIPQ